MAASAALIFVGACFLTIYTFRDDGTLESIVVSTINPDGSRVIDQKVEIYDTEKGEIDRIFSGITAMIPQ